MLKTSSARTIPLLNAVALRAAQGPCVFGIAARRSFMTSHARKSDITGKRIHGEKLEGKKSPSTGWLFWVLPT